MTTTLLRFKLALILAAIALSANNLKAATLFEDFENPSVASTNNNGVQITYPTGVWYTYGITKPTNATENDRINGIYSMRMRGYDSRNSMYMMFDKAGAGVLSFKYGSYSNHFGGEFTVQKSTDGGLNWVAAGTPVTVPKWSGTFLTYSLPVNYNGNIRFKIVVTCRTPNNPNEQFNIDDFMVTDYGTEQVAMPTSNVPTGVYETPQTVTLTSTTAGASIYYTTDGTEPTIASSLYSSPLSVSSTTRIRAIAIASGKENSRVEDVLISFPIAVTSLAELTSKMAASGTNLTYFKYTGEAVISYVYATSSPAAYGTTVTKYAFLQDNTAGVSLKDNNKALNTIYIQGDKVTNIICQVYNINNTAQIFPIADFTVLSANNTIVPQTATIEEAKLKMYQLVQLNNVFFDGADGVKTFSASNSLFYLREGQSEVSNFPIRTIYLFSGNPEYYGSIVPTESRNIIGVVNKSETFFTSANLIVRSSADLNVQLSGISQPTTYNLSVSANKVHFETLAPEAVKVYSINGQLVKSIVSVAGKNSVELAKGVYLIRIGDKTAKVLL